MIHMIHVLRSGFFWEPTRWYFNQFPIFCWETLGNLGIPRPLPQLWAAPPKITQASKLVIFEGGDAAFEAEESFLEEALGDSWHQTRLDGDLISWDLIVKPVTNFHPKKLRKPTISSEYMYKNINERYYGIVNNIWLYPDIWHLHQCIENSDREHEVSNMFKQWEVSSNARIVWRPFGLMGSLYSHSSPNNCHTS